MLPSPTVLVQADDFSGAAEVGQQFAARGFSTRITLTTAEAPLPRSACGGCEVAVVDTHTRGLSAPAASAAVKTVVKSALAHLGGRALIFKKTDSLWRGNLGPELTALGELGYHVVLAGALPALKRTVMGSKPFVEGRTLLSSGLWNAESRRPPEDLVELFPASTHIRFVQLAEVRSADFTGRLKDALRGTVPVIAVVDGETEADLAAVVETLAGLDFFVGRPVALAGTGQLAGLLAHRLAEEAAQTAQFPPDRAPTSRVTSRPGAVLAIVGSASPVARRQVEHLVEAGFDVVDLPSGTEEAESIREALAEGRSIALTVAGAVDPARSGEIVAHLARLTREVQKDLRTDLILTGGETAREVLDALGICSLVPHTAVQHGAVVSTADDGRLVATKPGSFGDPLALAELYRAIQLCRATQQKEETPEVRMTNENDDRPFLAVTMGDGAGVGPEVTVGALTHPGAYADSRPVVIGDAPRLRLAAEALGATPEIATVHAVNEAVFTPNRINVIDPELLPEDLPWGQESAKAGNAAFHYVRIACELAMAGKVQGICTAPLNKAALHKAGHIFPGHTELLAHFMGVDEVSMMLSTPKVKVIHVTTHVGLVDAIRMIEPGLVERTVRRGAEAMKRAGVAEPRIGVCAINPHAGENGLFGYGEEEEKIVPAIERLRADGIDARGPLPADTAFFLAGRGDYDLIVAMYHDQGHGPVKVLGIEEGVNITVGLPVIRTSVDHGTAFDIAGQGIVDVRSMIEALRQAAEMSPRLPVGSGPA
ncbi:MAG TPA: 4-hydroxythreonine-4-phosphate dehydrogenase PdxA [Sinomonas sp.]|nr:4-hydroxythreonine-4-phosphate dehydrogenase PdxA [Sinomonas sp.]